jgi:hypothetical protein
LKAGVPLHCKPCDRAKARRRRRSMPIVHTPDLAICTDRPLYSRLIRNRVASVYSMM